ncbi:peptide-methionine (S)-S-oxide reductase [Aquimarina sp. 2201CG1-2-11]|uniref:peptide-methionine (S)-S-oxide reductase n=1 Tax=Aquimarina discodermiae TaxID=3231043 RepID=UPI0034631725
MRKDYSKIAFGGGCHWCTEAVFLSLKGVDRVEQGYAASIGDYHDFSEAVIVHFNTNKITLETLLKVHLYTHKSTSDHSMRSKYRSAVYVYDKEQETEAKVIVKNLQKEFDDQLITKVLPFKSFKMSREEIQNYYYKNPEKPFCKTFIAPKLKLLLEEFSDQVNSRIEGK